MFYLLSKHCFKKVKRCKKMKKETYTEQGSNLHLHVKCHFDMSECFVSSFAITVVIRHLNGFHYQRNLQHLKKM